jgi:hypothetical protein
MNDCSDDTLARIHKEKYNKISTHLSAESISTSDSASMILPKSASLTPVSARTTTSAYASFGALSLSDTGGSLSSDCSTRAELPLPCGTHRAPEMRIRMFADCEFA